MNKEKKPVKKKSDEMITFQNYCIQNNLTNMDITGLKTHLQATEQTEYKEKELTKAFNNYKKQPAFKKI